MMNTPSTDLTRNYRVVITEGEDGGHIADIPMLKHCVAYGETIEESMTISMKFLTGCSK